MNQGTPKLHQSVVMRCILNWGLFSAMISSSHNKQHPPSRNGGKFSEDGVWLAMWRGNKNDHIRSPPTLWNAFVSVQWHTLGDFQNGQLGNAECQRRKYITSLDIQKRAIKSHSCRITCERSESFSRVENSAI